MADSTIRNSITFIIDSLAQGGTENVCVTLANGLAKKGWDVHICVLTSRGNILINDLETNVEVEILGIKNVKTGWIAILNYLRRNKAKKVMCFFYQTSILLILLKFLKLISPKVIIRCNNTLSVKHEMHKDFYHKYVLRYLTRFTFPYADLIIAQSQGMKEDLIKHYNVQDKHLTVIHNPVKSKLTKALTKPSEKVKPVDILCVGRFVPAKGFEDAIQAISQLKNTGQITSLRLVGNGPEKQSYKFLAKTLNVTDQIDYVDFVDDVQPYFENAKLTLLSSRYEGFPNVLVESIWCGTPIVAYDCQSGPKDIVTDSNGVLVPKGNIDLLTKAINQALNKKWDKQKISQTANRFNAAHIVTQYEELLK